MGGTNGSIGPRRCSERQDAKAAKEEQEERKAETTPILLSSF
jgi:hypothetical protein